MCILVERMAQLLPHVQIDYRLSNGFCGSARTLSQFIQDPEDTEYVTIRPVFPKVSLIHSSDTNEWKKIVDVMERVDMGVGYVENPLCSSYGCTDEEVDERSYDRYHHLWDTEYRFNPLALDGLHVSFEAFYRLNNPQLSLALDALESSCGRCGRCQECKAPTPYCWRLTQHELDPPDWWCRLNPRCSARRDLGESTRQDVVELLKAHGRYLCTEDLAKVLLTLVNPIICPLDREFVEMLGSLRNKLGIFTEAQWVGFYRKLRQTTSNIWIQFINTSKVTNDEKENVADLNNLTLLALPKVMPSVNVDEKINVKLSATERIWVRPPDKVERGPAYELKWIKQEPIQVPAIEMPLLDEVCDRLAQVENVQFQRHPQKHKAMLTALLGKHGSFLYIATFTIFQSFIGLTWEIHDPTNRKRICHWASIPPSSNQLTNMILAPLGWHKDQILQKAGFSQARDEFWQIYKS